MNNPVDRLVRASSDWAIPEPWEVVEIARDGGETVVARTPTQQEAESKALPSRMAPPTV